MKKYIWFVPVIVVLAVVGAPGFVWLLLLLGAGGYLIRDVRRREREKNQAK